MKSTNWDFSLGAHTLVCPGVIAGIAANYQRDYVDFHEGGHSTRQTGQGAIYGIVRGDMYYLYGDAIFGMTSGEFRRPIEFGGLYRKAKSRPQTTQGLFYGEAGLNFCLDCGYDLLLQPFFAGEYGHYQQKRFAECSAGSLGLEVKSANLSTFDTYLGTHIFGTVGCVNLSADVAWQHRWDYHEVRIDTQFQDFGSYFNVHGSDLGPDGIRGSVNAAILITDMVSVYADIFGERWKNWAAHGADIGFAVWW